MTRTRNILLMYDAAHWKDRAEEVRVIAEGMSDPLSKEQMLRIAEDYLQQAAQALRLTALLKTTEG